MRRTLKQNLALAYGTMAYRNRGRKNLGFNTDHIQRRNKIEAELAIKNLQMCWRCEQGFSKSLDTCPHCQTPVIPF